ncbi:MAG: hypothetical protein EOP05_01430 [Proteobacteria bacterium]|nr:MAG: hypothetical protein EOP05_01430 [Pseudomonadota bacterium]
MRLTLSIFALMSVFTTAAFASQLGTGVKHISCDVVSKSVNGQVSLVVKSIEGLKISKPTEIKLKKGNGISMKGQTYWAVVSSGLPNQQLSLNAAVGNAADNYRLGELQVSIISNGVYADAAYCRLPLKGQFN